MGAESVRAEPTAPDEAGTMQDTYTTLFGHPDGRFAVLMAPRGVISPPHFGDLTHLGDPADVVRHVLNARMGPGRPQAQQEVAELLGVSQQTVSRYGTGASVPDVKDERLMSSIVRLHYSEAR